MGDAIAISDLSQQIEVKRIALEEDWGFGEPGETEVSVATIRFAKVKELSRKESVMEDMSVEDLNYRVTIRYRDGVEILKNDVIIWNGMRLKALTSGRVEEIDKKKYIIVMAIFQNG